MQSEQIWIKTNFLLSFFFPNYLFYLPVICISKLLIPLKVKRLKHQAQSVEDGPSKSIHQGQGPVNQSQNQTSRNTSDVNTNRSYFSPGVVVQIAKSINTDKNQSDREVKEKNIRLKVDEEDAKRHTGIKSNETMASGKKVDKGKVSSISIFSYDHNRGNGIIDWMSCRTASNYSGKLTQEYEDCFLNEEIGLKRRKLSELITEI